MPGQEGLPHLVHLSPPSRGRRPPAHTGVGINRARAVSPALSHSPWWVERGGGEGGWGERLGERGG